MTMTDTAKQPQVRRRPSAVGRQRTGAKAGGGEYPAK